VQREIDRHAGPAEIVVGDRRYPVTCSYTVRQDMTDVSGMGGTELVAGSTSWRGSFNAEQLVTWEIFEAATARLELPDGRAGDIVVLNNSGAFTGTGSAPQ
jgi:hypothetical protein